MIIRMTVEDNDFTELLENFANDLRELFFQETKSSYENDYNPKIIYQLVE